VVSLGIGVGMVVLYLISVALTLINGTIAPSRRNDAPVQPEAAQCWVRMPTGCSQTLSETSTPMQWFVDSHTSASDSSGCIARLKAFNSWCQRTDGANHWGFQPVEPEVLKKVAPDANDGKSCNGPTGSRIVIAPKGARAGFNDRVWHIQKWAIVAGTLCADLYIPRPCTMLARKHNMINNGLVECSYSWKRYFSLRWPIYEYGEEEQRQAMSGDWPLKINTPGSAKINLTHACEAAVSSKRRFLWFIEKGIVSAPCPFLTWSFAVSAHQKIFDGIARFVPSQEAVRDAQTVLKTAGFEPQHYIWVHVRRRDHDPGVPNPHARCQSDDAYEVADFLRRRITNVSMPVLLLTNHNASYVDKLKRSMSSYRIAHADPLLMEALKGRPEMHDNFYVYHVGTMLTEFSSSCLEMRYPGCFRQEVKQCKWSQTVLLGAWRP